MTKDDKSYGLKIDDVIRMLYSTWNLDIPDVIDVIEVIAYDLKILGYDDDSESLYAIAGILKLFNDNIESIIDNLKKSQEK